MGGVARKLVCPCCSFSLLFSAWWYSFFAFDPVLLPDNVYQQEQGLEKVEPAEMRAYQVRAAADLRCLSAEARHLDLWNSDPWQLQRVADEMRDNRRRVVLPCNHPDCNIGQKMWPWTGFFLTLDLQAVQVFLDALRDAEALQKEEH